MYTQTHLRCEDRLTTRAKIRLNLIFAKPSHCSYRHEGARGPTCNEDQRELRWLEAGLASWGRRTGVVAIIMGDGKVSWLPKKTYSRGQGGWTNAS